MGFLFLVWYPLVLLPPTNCHQPIATNQLPPTNCHPPIATNHLSPTSCHQPIATHQSNCHQPFVQLSSTNCHRRIAAHQLPPAGVICVAGTVLGALQGVEVAGSPHLCQCDLHGRRGTCCSPRGRVYDLGSLGRRASAGVICVAGVGGVVAGRDRPGEGERKKEAVQGSENVYFWGSC